MIHAKGALWLPIDFFKVEPRTTADTHLRRYRPALDLLSVEGVESRLLVDTDVDRDFTGVIEVLDSQFDSLATVKLFGHLIEDLVPPRQDARGTDGAADLV